MELWIRSQDRERLCKANNLFIKNFTICCSCNEESNDTDYLGIYKSKERALEVLDEIQSKMREKFIVKSHAINNLRGIDREEERLKWKYNKEFIMEDPSFEFIPINGGIIVYDMPKE